VACVAARHSWAGHRAPWTRGWWLRQIRTEWKRRFEHISIALGLTYVKTDPYISREMAILQEQRNRENAALLEQCKATNEHGQTYTLAELAATGMGTDLRAVAN
jgi:hypothetical protein